MESIKKEKLKNLNDDKNKILRHALSKSSLYTLVSSQDADPEMGVDDEQMQPPAEGEQPEEGADPNQQDPNAQEQMGDPNQQQEEDPDSLESMENNLFADLTPQQISIKNSELMQNYIDLYDTIDGIFDDVNKIPKTYNNTRVLEFIAEKLSEMKDNINYTINTTYSTKTYTENLVIYKQYLVILQQINNMLKGLVRKPDDKDK